MKTYIAGLLLAGCLSTSCSDFLTLGPEHSLTMDNSVTSYSGAQNVVMVFMVFMRAVVLI